jgi:hypothetical protein
VIGFPYWYDEVLKIKTVALALGRGEDSGVLAARFKRPVRIAGGRATTR